MRKGQHFARTFKRAVAVEYSQFYPRASEHQSIRASFVIFTFYSNKKGVAGLYLYKIGLRLCDARNCI